MYSLAGFIFHNRGTHSRVAIKGGFALQSAGHDYIFGQTKPRVELVVLTQFTGDLGVVAFSLEIPRDVGREKKRTHGRCLDVTWTMAHSTIRVKLSRKPFWRQAIRAVARFFLCAERRKSDEVPKVSFDESCRSCGARPDEPLLFEPNAEPWEDHENPGQSKRMEISGHGTHRAHADGFNPPS